MKVLALGGSGGMGRYAVRAAMGFQDLQHMTIADLNGGAAKKFAASLGERASGIGLNIENKPALQKAMREADVVLNTAGPFFKYGLQVLEAAIETKRHYLDICDDWEPTEKMLALNPAAEKAGITAIIGLGASPGLTSLVALLAMRELDEVEKTYTGWALSAAVPEEESSQTGINAAMLHAIQQITGKVAVWRHGRREMARPLKKVKFAYPGTGTGKSAAHIFGHPEAVSFPHHYPEIKESLNLVHGSASDIAILRLLRSLVDWRLLSQRRAAAVMGWLEAQQSRLRNKDGAPHSEPLPPIFGWASGKKQGKPAQAAAALVPTGNIGMGRATGLPLAIGLEMLLAGEITRRGVFAPEAGAIDPARFFDRLHATSPEGLPERKKMVVINRSWM